MESGADDARLDELETEFQQVSALLLMSLNGVSLTEAASTIRRSELLLRFQSRQYPLLFYFRRI